MNELIPTELEKAFFEVGIRGVEAHYKFRDISNRCIEIKIKEENEKPRKPFGILAPMGDAAAYPSSMPLVFLREFYFVRKKYTEASISIDNRIHQLDQLPVPIDWQQMTFARYSAQPIIATLNPDYNDYLEGMRLENGQRTLKKNDCEYSIDWVGNEPCLKTLCANSGRHQLHLNFSPPFPCLNNIAPESVIKGRFEIAGHASVGSVSGEYFIGSQSQSVQIQLIPSGGWKPKATKLSTWFLFTVAAIFKKWPSTYRWDAKLYRSEDNSWHMDSKWVRTGRIMDT